VIMDGPFGDAELPMPGPTSQLLSGTLYYSDQELIKAQCSELIELDRRASELESQVLSAQARLGALAVEARDVPSKVEQEQIAALVPWAEEESAAIVRDAQRRAAELSLGIGPQPKLEDLGRLLLSHFEMQERLVQLLREAALRIGPR
jgi:hypothetical protein